MIRVQIAVDLFILLFLTVVKTTGLARGPSVSLSTLNVADGSDASYWFFRQVRDCSAPYHSAATECSSVAWYWLSLVCFYWYQMSWYCSHVNRYRYTRSLNSRIMANLYSDVQLDPNVEVFKMRIGILVKIRKLKDCKKKYKTNK